MRNDWRGCSYMKEVAEEKGSEKLKEELKMAVCQYSDYNHYSLLLEDVLEEYDESLEHYDFEAWFNGNDKISRGKLTIKAMKMLGLTADLFREIQELAEFELKKAFNNILDAGTESQNEILGMEISHEIMENIFERIYELEYHYNMEETYECFLEFVQNIASKK